MFDKVNIRGIVDVADIDTIVLKNYLEECSEGDEVFYRSTAYANLSGLWIELRGVKLKCKCSIHKLWAKSRTGKLDNSRPMTFAMAVRTIKELLLRLCLRIDTVVVTYYEVGLTMRLSVPAQEVIKLVNEAGGRVLWNDANYPENRQKTSEKSKYYRKVMKIYDKSYEAEEKGKNVGERVLRIETIYKHQNVKMEDLINSLFLDKIGRIFFNDWMNLRFKRELRPKPGVKMSEIEKAREIHHLGVMSYKNKYRELWRVGLLTKKQWETMRSYANRWDKEECQRYEEIESDVEREYKEKLLAGYQVGIMLPYRRKSK